MDFDYSIGDYAAPAYSDAHPDGDLVRWQGSQTNSIALNALMKDAAITPARRSPRNHSIPRSGPWMAPGSPLNRSSGSGSSSSSVFASSSSSKQADASLKSTNLPQKVPKIRSNALGYVQDPIATDAATGSTPAPSNTLSISSDSFQFLQTLKDVSQKVSLRVDGGNSVGKKRTVNGKVKLPSSSTPSMTPEARAKMRARNGIGKGKAKERLPLRRSTTFVMESEKEREEGEMEQEAVGHRSLPDMEAEHDMDTTMGDSTFSMDLDSPFQSRVLKTESTTQMSPVSKGKRSKEQLLNERIPSTSHSSLEMPPPPLPFPLSAQNHDTQVPIPKIIKPPRPARKSVTPSASTTLSDSSTNALRVEADISARISRSVVTPIERLARAKSEQPPDTKPTSNHLLSNAISAPKSHPNVALQPKAEPVPSQIQFAPPPQSSQRPPALGMRRCLAPSTYSQSQIRPLPDKRRGFKVPLARTTSASAVFPQAQAQAQAQTQAPLPPVVKPEPDANMQYGLSRVNERVLPTPEPSPSPNEVPSWKSKQGADSLMVQKARSSSPAADADSSFGEMSFDMDALEETMQKYD